MKYSDKLFNRYKEEIRAWDWSAARKEALNNCFLDEEGNIVASVFIGSVFGLYPSGKYWTFWACSNMTAKEQIKDTAFSEALEEVANEKGYWVTSGEGCFTDVFLQFSIELGEVEELLDKEALNFVTSEDADKVQDLLMENA